MACLYYHPLGPWHVVGTQRLEDGFSKDFLSRIPSVYAQPCALSHHLFLVSPQSLPCPKLENLEPKPTTVRISVLVVPGLETAFCPVLLVSQAWTSKKGGLPQRQAPR